MKEKLYYIELCTGDRCIVDEEDFHLLKHYYWHYRDDGYAYRYNRSRKIYMAREIMGVNRISHPDMVVDHINGNRLDNRKQNLRIVTSSCNSQNRRKSKNATSKYLGVSYEKISGKWKVSAYVNGKHYWIGRFKNEDDAAIAYNHFIKKVRGESARLNVIGEKH